jgi:hypothetical protein
MFVLSGSAIVLWLTPLTALDKRIGWHKSMQGLSLCAAIACAVSAGNLARKLAEENEIEEMKTRAIKADVVDEIGTSVYISQQQRQQEAEIILASPTEVEAKRESLEALYDNNLQEETTAITSEKDASDLELWWKVEAAQIEGKTQTWIIENLLGKKGRKFAEGKAQLAELLKKFGE